MLTVNRGGDNLARSCDEEQRCKDGGVMIGCHPGNLDKGQKTSKRRGDLTVYHLTRSDKKQKTCEGVGETSSGGLCLDATTGLIDSSAHDWLSKEVELKMAQSVVSVSLFDGCTNILTCSGFPIEIKRHVIRLLTSEIVGRTFTEKRNSGCAMKMQVCDAFNNVTTGRLEQYFLHHGFTVINVEQSSLDISAVHLDDKVEILPNSNLAGIELEYGKPASIRGILTEDSSTSEAGIELSYSTCQISKAGDGGPLFDGNGNFVGMNLFLDTKRGAFMRIGVINERLKQFEKRVEVLSRRRRRIPAPTTRQHDASNQEGVRPTNQDRLVEDLDSLGYPKPVEHGMVLVNNFEDTFGDEYDSGQGVWGMLDGTISKDLSQTVVSLASYKGETRLFACSGIVTKLKGSTVVLTSASLVRDPLDENKIDESLRIVVLLADKQRTEGTLQHCSLHYNIAVVSFKDSCAHPTANLYDPGAHRSSEVITLGRCFESGTLMAMRGELTRWHWKSRFDCGVLQYSSCEITKAGIGGPTVDFEGKFLGLNFYDKKQGTPFLMRPMILRILKHFEEDRYLSEADDDGYTYRWPVPKPFWCRPDQLRRIEDKE